MADTNKILLIGGAAAAAYFLFFKPGVTPSTMFMPANNSTAPGSTDTTGQPLTTYPYLAPGAPPIPIAYDQNYYLQYIRPAMAAANAKINDPTYVLSQADAQTYMANYTDIGQWANNAGVLAENQTGHSLLGALQYHWHTYGPQQQRTFLPLPWNYPAAWIPPPVHPKSSGGGIFGTLLKVATFVGGAVAEVASAGALTPIVVPATTSALALENQMIHGVNDVVPLTDAELQLLFTGSAVLIDILPYYNQANKKTVKAINNKLHSLLNYYSQ